MIKKYGFRLWVMMSALLIGLSFTVSTSIASTTKDAMLAATPEWTSLASLPRTISDGATFILNDKLYYAGGRDTTPTAEIYALNLKSLNDGWQTSEALNPARFGSGVTIVNGRAFVVGGIGGIYLANVDSFDGLAIRSERALQKGLWSPAVVSTKNRIYVAGGEMANGSSTNEVWSAGVNSDGKLSDWRVETALPRGLITRMATSEKCVYVIGGKSGNSWYQEIYSAIWAQNDPSIIIGWQNTGSLPIHLALHAVAIDQNTLYVLGGETTGGALNDKVFAYTINPQMCALTRNTALEMTLPGGGNRRLAAATRFGELYVLGGQTEDGYTNQVWKAELPTEPLLTLTKSAHIDGEFDYGTLITYTLNYVANPWYPDAHHNVVITDTIPDKTTVITTTLPSGVLYDTERLTWTIGTLPAHDSGVVSFTAQVDKRALDWEVSSAVTITGDITYPEGTLSLLLGPNVQYTLVYTPTGQDQTTEGLLITATLPTQLFPTTVSGTSNVLMAYQPARSEILLRIPGPITQTGYVTISHCISETFIPKDLSPIHAVLYDVLGQTRWAEAAFEQGEYSVPVTCSPPGTWGFAHPTTVPPLDPVPPDYIIRNRAWICSAEMADCQPSNETVTRYWPAKIFLPLVVRQY